MHNSIPYNTVVIVRAKPDSRALQLVRRTVDRATGSCLLFFHGPAVAAGNFERWSTLDYPSGKRARPSLRVCSAAWQRHGSGQLPPGFEVASLTVFWHLARQADQLISIGQGNES